MFLEIVKAKSSERNDQSLAAREGLKKLIQEHYPSSKDIDLSIIRHHHLEHAPNILVSITHTEDWAIAAIKEKEDSQGIGIDIEKITRPMNERTKRFFVNQEDRFDDSLLHLWVQKEACFKALSVFIEDLTLKKVIVQGEDFHTEDVLLYKGTVTVEKRQLEDEIYLIGKAVLTSIE